MTTDIRASGRTTRIIAESLKNALDNPGTPVPCKDHFDEYHAHEYVTAIVARLLKRMQVPHKANLKEHTVMVLPIQGK